MKKLSVFILIALLLLSVCLFVSCNKDKGGAADSGDAVTTTGGGSENTDPSLPNAVFSAEELTKYVAVRFDDAVSEEKTLFTNFVAELKDALGVNISSGSDFLFPGETADEFEILFGETVRDESVGIYNELKYNDYVIAVVGSKIVIAGGSDEGLKTAADKFISFIKDGTLTIPSSRFEYNAEYRYPEMKLDGVSISEYSIIYSGARQMESAKIIRAAVGEISGIRLDLLVHNKNEKTEREIVVGATNRYQYGNIPFYSYKSFSEDKSLYVSGYDKYALDEAVYVMADKIAASSGELTLEDLCVSYELPDYTEYIEDIDKLYMRWGRIWQPDEKMLDYEAKLDAFRNVSNRLLTCAHRAECYYYPENSIESIISFYKMGGDVVELDIQATADGVLVLMHDTNLKRMTNWEDFAGLTVDGIEFPESNAVGAWTYEQLQYLNLKDGEGGSGAALTPFKIPTLVEALKVCKDRLLIIPDKTDLWDYLPGGSKPNLYDAMVEANNFESIIISYGLNDDPGAAMEIQEYIYTKSGVRPLMLVRSNSDPVGKVYNKFVSYGAVKGSYGVQVNGRFDPATFPERYKDAYNALRGKVLIWGWTISDEKNGYSGLNDCSENWSKMYNLGYRMIMTNKYLELVKFASTKI